MNFSVNSTFLYLIAGAVVIFVLAQSVFFLVRAWRRGREIGIELITTMGEYPKGPSEPYLC